MILNVEPSVCVCVLAHNEEKHIERTIAAICNFKESNTLQIYVYANGCTDRTSELVSNFACIHENVHLCELPIASKPCAWNTAFSERKHDFIIFSDGDVIPASGAVQQLVHELKSYPEAIIATCRQVAVEEGLSFQQRFVGFMQIPLVQSFLAGGFYAVRRQTLVDLLHQYGFNGLPPGVAGEDAFLYYLVGPSKLIVSESRSAYFPPDLSDYCKYLARIRWQNEQIRCCWKSIVPDQGSLHILVEKARMCRNYGRLPLALLAVATRYLFKLVMTSQLKKHYNTLGPISVNGSQILSNSTRSHSTK